MYKTERNLTIRIKRKKIANNPRKEELTTIISECGRSHPVVEDQVFDKENYHLNFAAQA